MQNVGSTQSTKQLILSDNGKKVTDMVATEKIKNRLKETGISQTEVASRMGLAQSTFNQKIRNHRPFKLDEARRLQQILDIPDSQFDEYFFSARVT